MKTSIETKYDRIGELEKEGFDDVERLKEWIELQVALQDWVSFAELNRKVPGHLFSSGELSLVNKADENIIFWMGFTDIGFQAIRQLLEEERIHFVHCEVFIYVIEGSMLKLPLVVKPPKDGYRKPHWIPVCMRLGPPE